MVEKDVERKSWKMKEKQQILIHFCFSFQIFRKGFIFCVKVRPQPLRYNTHRLKGKILFLSKTKNKINKNQTNIKQKKK